MRLFRLAPIVFCAPLSAQGPSPPDRAVESITAEDVLRRVAIIADDSMLGRDNPSPGLEKTAAYVASEFRRLGLSPAGENGGYMQRFGINRWVQDTGAVLSRGEVPNVIAKLEGTDPVLRREYVVYSAHIDHIGVSPGQPDSINNGADDNASGVAGLLELAEAFSQPGARPKRSILFLAPSAEERGLLGSAHFVEHPTVPLGDIVADINMDLIGRNWPDSVIALGLDQSDLGETLMKVTAAHPELQMTPIRDRWPEERIFYRSDHYNFARKGIPILFFTSGTHSDYHRPSDEPGRINGEKESRLVRLLFYLGTSIANQRSRPQWTSVRFQ